MCWSNIQPKLQQGEADVVLFLDCCYAGQAARDHGSHGPRVDLLAAAGMGVKTFAPSSQSFTTALIKELKRALEGRKGVSIEQLCRNLARAEARLIATPVYVPIEIGHQRSIRLEVLKPQASSGSTPRSTSITGFQAGKNQVRSCENVLQWLKTIPLPTVPNCNIEDIIAKMEALEDFIQSEEPRSFRHISRHIPAVEKDKIIAIWNKSLKDLPRAGASSSSSRRFIKRLEGHLSALFDTIERILIELPYFFSQREALLEAVEDESLQRIGLADRFRRRMLALYRTESISMRPSPYDEPESPSMRSTSTDESEWTLIRSDSYDEPSG